MIDLASLSALLDAVGEIVVRRDADGRVTYVNAAFRRAFGGGLEDWIGRWFGVGPAEWVNVPGGRRRYDAYVLTVAGPSWFEWEETPLPGGGGVAIGRDVSARRAGEIALRDAREAAEAAARARETLFATVTHELRTPVTGVVGMARLLEASELTAEQRAYVRAVGQSGDHLLGLVDDILDAAKLESGSFSLVEGDADPAAVVQSVAELLATRARENGLEIATFVDPQTPRLVRTDAARLRQILLNLAGNAVKFTRTGGVAISLEREALEGPRAWLRFVVADTGPGVSEADKAVIFEAFAQADNSAARRCEGAGLGLAIVKRLAAAMGGTFGVESRPGAGATFWVRLPVAVVEAVASDETAPLGGVRAVIAAPERLSRRAIARQLEAAGATVTECERAGDLAADLAETSDCVAFVDEAWAEAAKASVAGLRAAIVLAAPDERGGLPQRLREGYAGWLVKPVRAASLIDRTARAWTGERADLDVETPSTPARPTQQADDDFHASVLLVEDNPINRLLATAVLRRIGCAPATAETGEEAVELAGSRVFDVILMDMRLPGLDGLAATRRIREGGLNAATPVVALTANSAETDRQSCLAAGMDDFLTKPVDEEAMRAVLARWTPEGKRANVG